MRLEPVADVPALLTVQEGRQVVVADLHIGLEAQLRASGFNIPSQTPRMLSVLERLSERADGLVILGDLKHKIPSVGYRENREIGPFLSRLKESYRRITLVAGNHDGGISSVLPDGVCVCPGRGHVLGDVGLFHGHVWPSEEVMRAKSVVMGHIHPAVRLVDSLGAMSVEKCWVRAKLKKKKVAERYSHCPEELVIVPAFNPLLTGTPINASKGSMIGPLMRNGLLDERRTHVFLLDGTNLGTSLVRRVV
ncbi:MAG: metallophosphoesterase [Thermoplasmata archaeon]